jgi:hypothetical protein
MAAKKDVNQGLDPKNMAKSACEPEGLRDTPYVPDEYCLKPRPKGNKYPPEYSKRG